MKAGLPSGSSAEGRSGRSSCVSNQYGRGKRCIEAFMEVNTFTKMTYQSANFIFVLQFISSILIGERHFFFVNSGTCLLSYDGNWSLESESFDPARVSEAWCKNCDRRGKPAGPMTATRRQEQWRLKVERKFRELPVT